MKKVRIGAGSAGWPDMVEPALAVAERGDIDFQGFDHLAELTMAILERQKAKNPERGYIPDVVPLMKKLLPIMKEKGFKVVSDAGGANPEQCAEAVINVARDSGMTGMKVGVITGDHISLERVDELRAQGIKFKNIDTGEADIDRVRDKLEAAYVYIGAEHVIEALDAGADVVLGGRLSDNSLFVGPLMHAFGWTFENADWDLIGAAIAIGHLLECAGWSSGVGSNQWQHVPEPWNLGFPIAEVYENGDAIITKAPGTGGLISEWTLKEHLVYEVHDPRNYLMPDGIADLTAIRLEQVGDNQVKVTGTGDNPRGKPRPDTLKFCMAYADGFISESLMVISAPKALDQARRVEEYIHKRLEIRGLKPREMLFSLIGVDSLHGPAAPRPDYEPNEVGIKIAFKADTEEEARMYRHECTLAWYAPGVGAAFGIPNTRPVLALWPTLIPREAVETRLEIREVR